MEKQYVDLLMEGLMFLKSVAVPGFIALNMLWVVILNFSMRKARKGATLTKFELFLKRIPKAWGVILQSIVLAIIWDNIFPVIIDVIDPITGITHSNRIGQFGPLFISITFSMIIWKLGFHKLFTATSLKAAKEYIIKKLTNK